MSRMVRDNLVSGLRERHWFGQLLLQQLRQRLHADAPRGELLALRGAVLFHFYSALVGLARNAARNAGLSEADQLLSLVAIAAIFEARQLNSPEINLLEAARRDQSDPLCWLEQQVMAASAASGLARRPAAPAQEGALAMVAEDPYAPLASGDLERLTQTQDRVRQILDEAAAYLEEW